MEPPERWQGLSAICSTSNFARTVAPTAAIAVQKAAAPRVSNVRDADGDFDGTKPGQVDPKDAGKGLSVDFRA
jgi:hypothetical protein